MPDLANLLAGSGCGRDDATRAGPQAETEPVVCDDQVKMVERRHLVDPRNVVLRTTELVRLFGRIAISDGSVFEQDPSLGGLVFGAFAGGEYGQQAGFTLDHDIAHVSCGPTYQGGPALSTDGGGLVADELSSGARLAPAAPSHDQPLHPRQIYRDGRGLAGIAYDARDVGGRELVPPRVRHHPLAVRFAVAELEIAAPHCATSLQLRFKPVLQVSLTIGVPSAPFAATRTVALAPVAWRVTQPEIPPHHRPLRQPARRARTSESRSPGRARRCT